MGEDGEPRLRVISEYLRVEVKGHGRLDPENIDVTLHVIQILAYKSHGPAPADF